MKKLLVFTMAACLALTMAACGGASSSASTAPAGSTPQETSAAPQPAGDPIVLTWAEVNGDDYGATVGAKAFKERIEALSGGQITVELYLNGTLGSEKECMQGIQMGTLDIFRGNASSLSNYGAPTIGLTGLPFLFQDMDQFQAMATSDLGQELLDSVDAEDCGYVALGWLTEGPRHMFLTESTYKTLGSPADYSLSMMNGLKMRVPETDLMVNTMTALNASATPIAYAELYTSLQSGVVDGAENDVINYFANSFNEVAPYFVPDAHTFGCGVILMNKEKWNSFTDEQKAWMQEAAETAGITCYEYNQEKITAAFASFEEKGVTLLEVTDLPEWSNACESVYATYDADAQAMIERLRSGEY